MKENMNPEPPSFHGEDDSQVIKKRPRLDSFEFQERDEVDEQSQQPESCPSISTTSDDSSFENHNSKLTNDHKKSPLIIRRSLSMIENHTSDFLSPTRNDQSFLLLQS